MKKKPPRSAPIDVSGESSEVPSRAPIRPYRNLRVCPNRRSPTDDVRAQRQPPQVRSIPIASYGPTHTWRPSAPRQSRQWLGMARGRLSATLRAMATKRPSLGRGLEALLGGSAAASSTEAIDSEVPPPPRAEERTCPNPGRPAAARPVSATPRHAAGKPAGTCGFHPCPGGSPADHRAAACDRASG